MYWFVEHEVWRHRAEEIRQEVAVYHLEKKARTNRDVRSRLTRDSRWELERYVGLLKKRLNNVI